VSMIPALMMVAMAGMRFVLVFRLGIAFLAVRAAVSVRGRYWAGTALVCTSLDWRIRRTCHTIQPLLD
jgi:hypothetical protein